MKTSKTQEHQGRPISRNLRRLATVEFPTLECHDDFVLIDPVTNRSVGRLLTRSADEEDFAPSWRNQGTRWSPNSSGLRRMGEE